MWPIIQSGLSSCPGVIFSIRVRLEEIGAIHIMNVSLSASWRQEVCISYSSARQRGSDAMNSCSFFLAVRTLVIHRIQG
jgi:hypothetical protein